MVKRRSVAKLSQWKEAKKWRVVRSSQTISIPSKVSVVRKKERDGKEHLMDIERTNSTHTMQCLVSEMTRYLFTMIIKSLGRR